MNFKKMTIKTICGSSKVIGPHKLIGSDILVWLCWGKCVTMGASFEVSYAQAIPSFTDHFLLPVCQDIELSALSPAPYDNELNL